MGAELPDVKTLFKKYIYCRFIHVGMAVFNHVAVSQHFWPFLLYLAALIKGACLRVCDAIIEGGRKGRERPSPIPPPPPPKRGLLSVGGGGATRGITNEFFSFFLFLFPSLYTYVALPLQSGCGETHDAARIKQELKNGRFVWNASQLRERNSLDKKTLEFKRKENGKIEFFFESSHCLVVELSALGEDSTPGEGDRSRNIQVKVGSDCIHTCTARRGENPLSGVTA